MKGSDCLEDPSVNEKVILKYVLKEIGWETVDWTNLA